jgi:hypothetical protein
MNTDIPKFIKQCKYENHIFDVTLKRVRVVLKCHRSYLCRHIKYWSFFNFSSCSSRIRPILGPFRPLEEYTGPSSVRYSWIFKDRYANDASKNLKFRFRTFSGTVIIYLKTPFWKISICRREETPSYMQNDHYLTYKILRRVFPASVSVSGLVARRPFPVLRILQKRSMITAISFPSNL